MTTFQHHVKKFVLWAISIFVSVQMLMAGVPKILGGFGWANNSWAVKFTAWGYPEWMPLIIGIAEVAGAIFLVMPKFALQAAGLLAAVMYAAVITEIVHSGFPNAIPALINLMLLGIILAVRWPRLDGIDPAKKDIAGEIPEEPDYEPGREFPTRQLQP